MPLRQLGQMFKNSPPRKYEKGQIILYIDDESTVVYFLKRGYVKMYSINEQGEERILMIFSPNTAFPIFPNMTDNLSYKIKYFYEAMTRVEIYQISRAEFGRLVEQNSEIAQLVLGYVTSLNGDLIRRLGVIEGKDAKNKISSLLPYLVKVCGKEVSPDKFRIGLKITHQDIAALTGLTRETASVQIKTLEDEGILEQNKNGRLVINQPSAKPS